MLALTAAHSPYKFAETVVAKLYLRGIESTITCDECTDGEVMLSVPQLEDANGMLSQPCIYRLISEFLEDHINSGLQIRNPVSDEVVGIFCFHPDTFMPSSDGADVEFWPAKGGNAFSWSALVGLSDDWCEGWELDGCELIGQRLAFLYAVLMGEVVSLPPYRPHAAGAK
ncbi:TPA: hypothetical protein L5U90_003217 [Pseudomonas aeruginosa]|nr:hypothetical protein [Pseudomonas aeruginosa]